MDRHLLVVDDEPLLRDLLTLLLSKSGYRVDQAPDGMTALRMSDEQKYDAILLDMRMPNVDGRSLYERLKERSADLAARIIFVTGDLANPQTASFLQATGNPYLEKPFTRAQLEAVLERFFRIRS
jgi:two-component system NtrC family sensor kinase